MGVAELYLVGDNVIVSVNHGHNSAVAKQTFALLMSLSSACGFADLIQAQLISPGLARASKQIVWGLDGLGWPQPHS